MRQMHIIPRNIQQTYISGSKLIKSNLLSFVILHLGYLNPLTPMRDQDRISPYYIYTISCRQVMGIKKNINYGIAN